jgi:predicted molibdopterin-dependent oxidoreductase YjgC
MFARLAGPSRAKVTISVDGRPVPAFAGDSVAAALIAAGFASTRRNPVSGRPRAPYCMMGACFECLVTIDGAPGRQACLVPVRDGMAIETQGAGAPA